MNVHCTFGYSTWIIKSEKTHHMPDLIFSCLTDAQRGSTTVQSTYIDLIMVLTPFVFMLLVILIQNRQMCELMVTQAASAVCVMKAMAVVVTVIGTTTTTTGDASTTTTGDDKKDDV